MYKFQPTAKEVKNYQQKHGCSLQEAKNSLIHKNMLIFISELKDNDIDLVDSYTVLDFFQTLLEYIKK